MEELGWSLEDAEAFCTKYGLVISVVEQETDAYAEGKVIAQSRAAGSPVVTVVLMATVLLIIVVQIVHLVLVQIMEVLLLKKINNSN